MNSKWLLALCVSAGIGFPEWANAEGSSGTQPLFVAVKRLSLDTALRVAQGAIEQCRKEGVQITATVVDRGGDVQVVLRDVLAADLSIRISQQKAYTAMSFNTPTSVLEGQFKSPFSVPKVEGVLMAPGGVPIVAGGVLFGGIGVSGAPSGETDEKCARAGVAAVADDLDMAQ